MSFLYQLTKIIGPIELLLSSDQIISFFKVPCLLDTQSISQLNCVFMSSA